MLQFKEYVAAVSGVCCSDVRSMCGSWWRGSRSLNLVLSTSYRCVCVRVFVYVCVNVCMFVSVFVPVSVSAFFS